MRDVKPPLPLREVRRPILDIPLNGQSKFMYPMTAGGKLMSIRERQIYQSGVVDGARIGEIT